MSNRDSPQNKPEAEAAVWEYCLPANPAAVPAARHAAIRACSDAGVGEEDCFALDLALGEALANAVTHGVPSLPGLRAAASISLRIWGYHDAIMIEVRDHGPGFDPPAPPYAMPAERGVTHGRGLPLMERLTDAFLVSRGDTRSGGVATYLVKRVSTPPPDLN